MTTIPASLGFVAGQSKFMKERGLEVHALSSPGPELDAFGRSQGVITHAVRMERETSPVRDLISLFQVLNTLRAVRPDIIHTHTPKAGFVGILAAFIARVPVRICHLHGLRFLTLRGRRRFLVYWAERISCLLANHVLCVSHSVRKVAVQEGTCPPEKIEVLLGGSINGVDVERFEPATGAQVASARGNLGIPNNDFVIGFIGRIVRDKGIVELSIAWQKLRQLFPEMRLLLVGPVEPDDPVPSDVLERLRADDRVILHGMDWNTPPLFAAMDLLVLPSYREGFPTAPLEASAMGLPVIATQVPGCMDSVQDGVTGTLIPAADPEALFSAIAQYRSKPELRKLHGEAGRSRVMRDFRQEPIWQATLGVYDRLLSRHRSSGSPIGAPKRA